MRCRGEEAAFEDEEGPFQRPQADGGICERILKLFLCKKLPSEHSSAATYATDVTWLVSVVPKLVEIWPRWLPTPLCRRSSSQRMGDGDVVALAFVIPKKGANAIFHCDV